MPLAYADFLFTGNFQERVRPKSSRHLALPFRFQRTSYQVAICLQITIRMLLRPQDHYSDSYLALFWPATTTFNAKVWSSTEACE
jgi:hypothetical protein